jgi:UDP:flavonoid glycosyltransferase YjiC (YdhE family)
VLVTQGTLADDPRELIEPTLRALADEPVIVVATTPAAVDAPANARVARFVPYAALLPHVAVLVTNGGYGGVQMALAHGVPMVVAGGSEEKPEIAARVAWSGAGIDLKRRRPSAARVRAAVRAVLADPAYRARAAAIADEMRGYDAPARAVELIERVVA